MLTIKNIKEILGYRFGITNNWECIGIDFDYDDQYIFQFKRFLPGNVAQYEDIVLERVGQWNDVVCKTTYQLNGSTFTIDYLNDFKKVKNVLSDILDEK